MVTGKGWVWGAEQEVEGNNPHGGHRRVCEGDMARVGVSHGMAECSETLAYKIQTPRNYPEESIKHSEHGKSLKSRSFN